MKNMNNDLISRQAVIDALEKVAELYPWRVPGDRDSYSQYNEAWQDALNRADSEIEALPSAQPELITWLLDKIWDEEMWELNWQAFPELLCRKLEKLGYVKRKGDEYERLDQQTGGD